MGDQVNMSVKFAAPEIRMGFVRKVYGILTAQLILTVMIAAPFSVFAESMIKTNPGALMPALFASSVLSIASVCAMTCFPDLARNYPTNYLLLFIFTVCESVLVGFTCSAYTKESVLGAFVLTAVLFLGLTIYAWTSKTDFTGMGPYLFGAILTGLIFGFGIWIAQLSGINMPILKKVFAGLMVLIFVMYIIYDTQMIIGAVGGHKIEFGVDDYVFAALNLYLDILNLFLYLLELFGDKK